METIWDHNPTDEELDEIGIDPADEYYRTGMGPDSNNIAMASLIRLRGGSVDDAMVYINRIQDPGERQCHVFALHEIIQ